MCYGLHFSNMCEFYLAFSIIYFRSILVSPRYYHTYRLYSLVSKHADLFYVKSEG